MPTDVPTQRETVTTYLDVLYNQRRIDLVPDLIADPTWRHHAGEVKQLSLVESISRLEATLELCPVLNFDVALLHEGGDMVTVRTRRQLVDGDELDAYSGKQPRAIARLPHR